MTSDTVLHGHDTRTLGVKSPTIMLLFCGSAAGEKHGTSTSTFRLGEATGERNVKPDGSERAPPLDRIGNQTLRFVA